MKKNKLFKLSFELVAAILLLVGGVSSASAAKKNSYNGTVNYSYSGKTHRITFTGTAKGFKNLTVKYNGKTIKNAKIKKNGKFKVTVPFKDYKTFKLYGNKHLLKTISAKKYASKKPDIDFYRQTNQEQKFSFYAKKGDVITIWKNGQPIQRRRVTKSDYVDMKVANTDFENKAKVMVTRHTLGKKTSKGVVLTKMKENTGVFIN